MTKRPEIWSPARVARLRALWAEPFTLIEIAEIMSAAYAHAFTKNAIIGKSHRLKLPPRDVGALMLASVKTDAASVKTDAASVKTGATSGGDEDDLPGLSLSMLMETSCRWPFEGYGAMRYCGATIARRAYCATHAKLAYNEKTGATSAGNVKRLVYRA